INKDIKDLEAYIKASGTDAKGVARKKLENLTSDFGDVKDNLQS
ncbi:18744_t:CDS:1, partial [Dentiscutata erythropus]